MATRRARPARAALIAAVGGALLLGGCGNTPATMAKLLEEQHHKFAELAEAEEIYCTPGEGYSGRETFDCHWHGVRQQPKSGTWEISPGNVIGRLSEGGGDSARPRSARQASAIVDSATLQHSTQKGSTDCLRILERRRGGVRSRPEGAYSCYLLSPYTGLAIPWSEGPHKGQPARLRWAWSANGTVAEDAIDTSSASEEVLEGAPPTLERVTPAIELLECVEGKCGISEEALEEEVG